MASDSPDHKYQSLSHAEKIEWMIETDGFAVEPVAPDPEASPPQAGYTYTIGFGDLDPQAAIGDIVVFGLTPAAARGLLGLVADMVRGGTELPLGVEVVGLLDNELRARFAPVDLDRWGEMFTTATAWYAAEPYSMAQLIYPDRNGFLPYESGFDQRMRFAQPVIGDVA